MNRANWTALRPMILVFIIFNALLITGRSFLEKKGIDQEVVLLGNVVLFIVSAIAFAVTKRSLRSDNPHVFVRAVYSGFIVKFFIVVIAAFVYFQLTDSINKPALFVVLALYFIYTFIEVSSLLRLLKGKKNNA